MVGLDMQRARTAVRRLHSYLRCSFDAGSLYGAEVRMQRHSGRSNPNLLQLYHYGQVLRSGTENAREPSRARMALQPLRSCRTAPTSPPRNTGH
jgi:hypothetical protein